MELSRYTFHDAYILEELRRKYQGSDIRGRIRLLRRLYKDGRRVPYHIALLAIEDPHVQVREWIAQHGKYLDYQEGGDADQPERNLWGRLRNDPDPYVRACLHENPDLFGFRSNPEEWKEAFRNATHLERLALVRNPRLIRELIEQVFDHEDQELGISLEARAELVKAFLTNDHALRDSFLRDQPFSIATFGGRLAAAFTQGHFSELWMLISKWPAGTGNLQQSVYRHIGAPDETKAEIYQRCDEPVWRQAILMNCESRDTRTIGLGMQDQDEQCRELAYSKVHLSQIHELNVILQGQDMAALRGLSLNRSLPVDLLQEVSGSLGDDLAGLDAEQTIKEVERKEPPPALGDKLDFMHEQLQSFKDELQKDHKGIEKNIRVISHFVTGAVAVAATIYIIIPLVERLSSIFKGLIR